MSNPFNMGPPRRKPMPRGGNLAAVLAAMLAQGGQQAPVPRHFPENMPSSSMSGPLGFNVDGDGMAGPPQSKPMLGVDSFMVDDEEEGLDLGLLPRRTRSAQPQNSNLDALRRRFMQMAMRGGQ